MRGKEIWEIVPKRRFLLHLFISGITGQVGKS